MREPQARQFAQLIGIEVFLFAGYYFFGGLKRPKGNHPLLGFRLNLRQTQLGFLPSLRSESCDLGQYRQYMNRRGGFNRPLDAAF